MKDFWTHRSLPSRPESNAVPQIRVRPSVTGLMTPRSSLPILCLLRILLDDGDVEGDADGEDEQIKQPTMEVHDVHEGDRAEDGVKGIAAVIQKRAQRR